MVWLTVDKPTLKDNRDLYGHRVLVRLAELLAADIEVRVATAAEHCSYAGID